MGGSAGFLHEVLDPSRIVHSHDAEPGGFGASYGEAADGNVRVLAGMLVEHVLVVHLVDVVAREHEEEFRSVAVDDVDVLGDGIRGPSVPLFFGDTLRSRKDVEKLVPLGPEEVPASLQVPDEAVGLVLGRDPDPPDSGVDRI